MKHIKLNSTETNAFKFLGLKGTESFQKLCGTLRNKNLIRWRFLYPCPELNGSQANFEEILPGGFHVKDACNLCLNVNESLKADIYFSVKNVQFQYDSSTNCSYHRLCSGGDIGGVFISKESNEVLAMGRLPP